MTVPATASSTEISLRHANLSPRKRSEKAKVKRLEVQLRMVLDCQEGGGGGGGPEEEEEEICEKEKVKRLGVQLKMVLNCQVGEKGRGTYYCWVDVRLALPTLPREGSVVL